MTIQSLPFVPASKHLSAWAHLVGPQPMPRTREEMLAVAKEVFERRVVQCIGDVVAQGDLTASAETLGVFGGPIDTQTHPEMFKAAACLPEDFQTVEAEKLRGSAYVGRVAAGEEEDAG